MNRHTTDEIERKARALYRRSCQALPAKTRHTLQRARLNAATTQPRRLANRMLMPAGALAASALALAVGWNYFPPLHHATPQSTHYSTDSTSAPVHDTDSTELYQNLDFYRWLATQTEQPPARN